MGDRKKIYYTFKGVEEWEQNNKKVDEIVKADTDAEHWACNKALPPTCYPPAMSIEAIDKLKQLDGVVVGEIDE
ncbi:hypothetical protein HRG_000721 [Hirsutella rhossiliensis]|uniref:Uncharacterized protein n=1 Tax=Hirsutella rhossiliensis TaxID=111463 RepID=A0A9P8N7B2_9HYPO|nr:uncharacterized protein HRG_00721 [Hirsutella rhossiliensis]KAH0968079.1 hypothetical protein HRG_00721 [Hirsutella rhossiliensis]